MRTTVQEVTAFVALALFSATVVVWIVEWVWK